VTILDDPYEDGSGKVASIGCTLKGDMQNPTWKVHVPIDLAASVGQELIRLANLDREKSQKASQPKTTHLRLESRPTPLETPHEQVQSEKMSAEEMKVMTDRAVEEGRVIKRVRKAVV
jgi:hypothetical protein